MSAPRVVAIRAGSPAERAGVRSGDEILSIDGTAPRDVIEYQMLVEGADPELELGRDGGRVRLVVAKDAGVPLGVEVSSALFDRVRTCDNHCEFCFIYQLPKGMRRSLYLKDDDYRLSFLYGNFTTLTRFTEMDLERVIEQRLSPIFVSVHSTNPELRARMLRNRRGATSLRWLTALLDAGIEVHAQVVVCPGVNDGDALEETMAGVLDRYPGLASVACVPLGLSRFSSEPAMRLHTAVEAQAVVGLVEEWQGIFLQHLGRRVVFAADEYYLMAGLPFPPATSYEGFPQHENGVGMARAFAESFGGDVSAARGRRAGFFAWVDGAPPEGYRAPRAPRVATSLHRGAGVERVTILSGVYGAEVLRPILDGAGFSDVRVLGVENRFFGGNIAVAGLLTFSDLERALGREAEDDVYLLPDSCLSEGRFLDGGRVEDLPRPVVAVASDGASLRSALLETSRQRTPPTPAGPPAGTTACQAIPVGGRR